MVAPRRVDVSPAMVDGAAKNFAVGQHDLIDTWMRLLGGLDGNHGMAGNDKAANIFNAKYAPAVQAAWKAFRQAIVVIGGASLGLTQTANNHLAADHRSRADASGGASALLGPNEVYPDMSLAEPQSAIGPAATGPYLGANRILATLLVGYWPAAHPNNLENAAGKWYAAANEVNKVAEWLNWSIGQLADSSKTRDFAAIQRYWHKVYQAGDGHSLLGGLIKLCNALGDACDRYANVTWATQNKINLIVSSQEVLVLLSAGSEGVITRLRGVFNRIAAGGAAAVGREVGAAVTEDVVAEAVAAAAETPKIEPIAADFEATAGKAVADEIGDGFAGKVTSAEQQLPRPVPDGWAPRVSDNGKGIVFQDPNATGNANMIRVMDPTPKYPNGYIRVYNSHGQPVDVYGKPGPPSATHIPVDYDGKWPGWPGG
ncbi:hypothetical protein [Actinoallomurus vinaceus]